MWPVLVVISVLVAFDGGGGSYVEGMNDLQIPERPRISVLKCCASNQVIVRSECTLSHQYYQDNASVSRWEPQFFTESETTPDHPPDYRLETSAPDCSRQDQWPIYSYPGSTDRLRLLTDGRLRHYVRYTDPNDEQSHSFGLVELEHQAEPDEPRFYDYSYGQYCIDTAIFDNVKTAVFASVCKPHVVVDWTDTHFIIHRIVDPICRAIAMIILLAIAIVYFILPQLRDLVGNIVTTITICLIVAQAADLVRTFTEYNKHVSFFAADLVVYTALMAAFFWINSMGYYVWRQFKSRDVFLRMTDGRKYCYYACYVWGCTLTLVLLACFTHFTFSNADPPPVATCSTTHKTIGWIGIAVFFMPIACLVIANIFFWRSTAHIISRISSFGRIHDKLKYRIFCLISLKMFERKCKAAQVLIGVLNLSVILLSRVQQTLFEMFVRISLIMTLAWFTLMLTWFQAKFLCYTYTFVNLLQSVLLLYVCVLSQSRVTLLLRKTCCYENCICTCCRPGEPAETCEWGEDMVYMNTLNNY